MEAKLHRVIRDYFKPDTWPLSCINNFEVVSTDCEFACNIHFLHLVEISDSDLRRFKLYLKKNGVNMTSIFMIGTYYGSLRIRFYVSFENL